MSYASNTMKLEIAWAHCDPAGIVWNPRFFEFFDTATWRLFEVVLGLPRDKLVSHHGIWGIPLIEAGANFQVPLAFGDSAEIVTTIKEIGRSSFALSHKIMKSGKLAVDGHEKRVWAGENPEQPGRLRGVPLPKEIVAKLAG